MVDQVCRRSTFDIIIILYAQDYFSYIIYESMYNFLVQFGSSACSTEVDRDEFALSFFIFVATTTRLYCIGIALTQSVILCGFLHHHHKTKSSRNVTCGGSLSYRTYQCHF